MNLPKDPVILVSYINTQLRDYYPSLTELCKSLSLHETEICENLADYGYQYNADINQFI